MDLLETPWKGHLDCARCGSAGSIEFGMCQVCLWPVARRPVSYLARKVSTEPANVEVAMQPDLSKVAATAG
jgi:ribosomal protein L37E